jgi:plastocyanin
MTSPALRAVAFVAAAGALVAAVALGRDEPEPYVITAIDYHFHDAHPTFPIAPGRDLVVKNDSPNVHNVTIAAIDYSHDVQPGQRLVIPDVASLFDGPGRYSMYCAYHEDRGMTGLLVIAPG